MSRLIVNADDLGRSAGVDEGIIRAHREGIVTSATLMANSPGAQHAAELVRRTPSLDVGVHLVLTFARPLSDPRDVPSLVERDGSFPKRPEAIVGTARVRRDDVLREYRAQYARARELVGREPTHLDSHHWVHDEPEVSAALAALALETGAAARIHDAQQRDEYRAKGIRTPDHFVRAFQNDGHIDIGSLEAILARIADTDGVTELMCHPGVPDEELLGGSSYARERSTELATLTDRATRVAVERLGIELVTFADI